MPTLDIYVSVKYTYSGGNLHAQITYAPGEVGYDTLFNIVENTIIANPDSPPTSFGDINSATNYYYPANSASIKASMDTYTGLTWDIDLLIKEKPENWVIDFATENTVSTMDSRVTVVENGLSDGLFAINSALADHASDPGAHPELSAAIYASLGSMSHESAIDYYPKTAVNSLLAAKLTPSIQTHISDAAINSPTNAASNAATDNPTNYNIVSGLLGIANGLNDANTKQNNMASIVNANATKQNTIATNVNAGFSKMNSIFDALEANSLLAA